MGVIGVIISSCDERAQRCAAAERVGYGFQVMFHTIRVQDLALLSLMHEVAADHRVTLLMIAALLDKTGVDREQLHADFLNRAQREFGGGPESFPPQAREAAIVLLGKLRA
jgi:hypothetical protein